MTTALKWKLVLGCLLIFVAGGVTGAWVWHAQMRHPHMRHSADKMAQHMMARLQHQLVLTPEQVNRLEPFVRQMAAELERIRRETGKQVHQVMEESHNRMVPVLSPEQRQKLEEMERRHERRARRRGFLPPPPPKPEGPGDDR